VQCSSCAAEASWAATNLHAECCNQLLLTNTSSTHPAQEAERYGDQNAQATAHGETHSCWLVMPGMLELLQPCCDINGSKFR
jgi:hypothetical protein